ncbi:GNAT family N-acetyltransferase [Natrinema halophilum]|uniref:GNAT family N-acetyltransferase n=1 Tax=Natrinema halophilum TaxID=1699371 RepID=A0A7D5KMN3_9EURY|nr:GNAT family N-acetyltransferase [Natrinema halophilum]QLG50878.1 GNAT family N-acetyltransferase [Natrinema halophilum]
MSLDPTIEIRRATHDDYEAVAAFTSDLWPERGGDYIPRIYHDWLEESDETGKKTVLAEVDGEVAGIVQGVMLSSDEAWFQGMRVAPDFRRQGVSSRLNDATFEWSREQGATVGRVMIFSWNTVSLGAARANGYEPITEFRFAHPDPDSDANGPCRVSSDPTAAWRYWTHSDARKHLQGLGLDPDESWAVRELTRQDFDRLSDETAVFAVEGDDGLAGVGYRSRTDEREVGSDDSNGSDDATESRSETLAEYGLAAWEDIDAARSLFAAIARDAADCGADETRVLIPETARFVTDAAATGTTISEEPDFVLGIDLTGR